MHWSNHGVGETQCLHHLFMKKTIHWYEGWCAQRRSRQFDDSTFWVQLNLLLKAYILSHRSHTTQMRDLWRLEFSMPIVGHVVTMTIATVYVHDNWGRPKVCVKWNEDLIVNILNELEYTVVTENVSIKPVGAQVQYDSWQHPLLK